MEIYTSGLTVLNGTETCSRRLELDEMQAFVGGFIEYVVLRKGAHAGGRPLALVINEEGKLDGLEPNPVATLIARKFAGLHGDYIAGPAILAALGDDGNTYALTLREQRKFSRCLQKAVGAVPAGCTV